MKPERQSSRQGVSPGRLRNAFVNGLLVVASLCVVLLVSEIAVRKYEGLLLDQALGPEAQADPAGNVLYENMPPQQHKRLFQWRRDGNGIFHIKSPNKKLVYEMRSSTRLNEALATNSSGFRDDEFSIEKPEGTYRIVVVGDSLTIGWNEPCEQTYPAVLEALLNRDCRGDRRFEVYNMGVGGYNAAQELELVKSKALAFHPDLVLVQYCTNDNLIGEDVGLWRHFSRSRLRVLDFAKLRWMRIRERFAAEGLVERSYRKLAAICREAGVPVLVAVFPSGLDTVDLEKNVDAFVRGLDMGSVYLGPVFEEIGIRHVMHDDAIHPNAVGHRIAAEHIYKYLKRGDIKATADWCNGTVVELDAARAQFRAGLQRQDAGEIEEAAKAYREAVALDRDYGRLAALLLSMDARQRRQEGELDKAVQGYRLACSFDPGNARTFADLGEVLADKEDEEGALEAWREAIRINPEARFPCENLDQILTGRGDIEARLVQWRSTVRRHPQAVRPLYHLAVALRDAGDTDAAIETFRKALALNPFNHEVRGHLGCVLAWQGDFEAALQVCREPEAIDSAFARMVADALEDGANVLVAQDRAEEASEGYRGAIELAPASAGKRYPLLIEALCQAGNYEAAREEVAVCREAGVKLPAELLEEVAQKPGRVK